ncbi:hypothetical protein U1Q18_027265 [Sarracenia purpurea var. burkii]
MSSSSQNGRARKLAISVVEKEMVKATQEEKVEPLRKQVKYMDAEVARCRDAISSTEMEKKHLRFDLNAELRAKQWKINDLEVRLQESERQRIREHALGITSLVESPQFEQSWHRGSRCIWNLTTSSSPWTSIGMTIWKFSAKLLRISISSKTSRSFNLKKTMHQSLVASLGGKGQRLPWLIRAKSRIQLQLKKL